METILVEERYILEYMKDMLSDIRMAPVGVTNAKYHHNTEYKDAPSICQHGILTMMDLKKFGIKNYTDEILEKMSDIESHINGNDSVSLAVVGLQDLYRNEDEYNPFHHNHVDFLISSSILTSRTTIHYGNEFLSRKSIEVDNIRAVDVRFLKVIELIEQNLISKNHSVLSAVDKYNYLKLIAMVMKNKELDIPLREMSNKDDFSIDIDKLSTLPKLILKN